MSINFETICRLCMAESKSMISVFEKSHSLTEKIMTLVPVVKISEGDNLPAQVCEGCVNQVNTWHSFKLQCENSHFTLSQLLKAQQQEDPQASDVPGLRRPPDVPPIETIILETKCKQEVEDEEREEFSESKEEDEGKMTRSECQLKKRTVACPICQKMVVQKRLNAHVKRHIGERMFPCEECGKAFVERSSLRKHVLVHSGIKSHLCDICGKAFKMPQHLKVHHLTHTGQKPHVCDICGKRFGHLGSFNTHVSLHRGERRFECDLCKKSYAQKNTLELHLAVHTGQRKHACEICGKRFLQSGQLKSHLVVHSKERNYSCEICGIKYTQKKCLTRHCLKKHRVT